MNCKFRFYSFAARAALAVILPAPAVFASPGLQIPLVNADFESGTLYQRPVEGWTYGSNESGSIYKDGRGGSSHGASHATVDQAGWIYQNSHHALLPNRAYVLSVDMKSPGCADHPGDQALQIWAGERYESAELLATTTIHASTLTTSWQPFSLTYISPAAGRAIGKPVWIRVTQLQAPPGQRESVLWDDVRFTAYDAQKKFIAGPMTGWKFPGDLLTQLPKLQDLPFDGIDIYTNFGDAALAHSATHRYASVGGSSGEEGSVGQMQRIVSDNLWGRYTDNFMHMTVAENLDWYDEDNWKDILKKVEAVARIGAAGDAKGIMFDPEGHSADRYLPWDYGHQPQKGSHTYAQMRDQVRARGVEFIRTIQLRMPNPTFITLFWTSYLRARNFDVQDDAYGLYNSFMLGVLEGAAASTQIVDGDELSYYSTTVEGAAHNSSRYGDSFGLGNSQVMSNAITSGLIPASLQAKYRAQVSVAHAVWDSDALVGNPAEVASRRVYYAMMSSPKYVWFYTEGARQYLNHRGIRPGMIEAIHEGKAEAQAGIATTRR
jgi:hypothetical protein